MRPDALDPALPSLPVAFDLDALARRFRELLREHEVSGLLKLEDCRRTDTSYEPGVRCIATYELMGEGPSGVRARTFGVLQVDPSGAACRVLPDDPALPALASAMDEEVMRGHLTRLSLAGLRTDSIDACKITAVRYKPGERCVLRYELRSEGLRFVLFGKLVAAGAHRLHATLVALDRARQTAAEVPRVPRPLSYLRDLGLVIQSAETGRTLTANALDDSPQASRTAGLMRSAGSAIAAFHEQVKAKGHHRTLEDDVSELCAYSSLFIQLTRDLAPRFDQALRAIEEYARSSTEPAPVASHGALRTGQFLVREEGELVLLDFDGFCCAAPARDVGNLLAYLDWRAIRRSGDRTLVDRACRSFLEGYLSVRALPEDSWLGAFRAASMLKIAGRRLRSLSFEEWELLPKLLDGARDAVPR
jgi:hypothetical protein